MRNNAQDPNLSRRIGDRGDGALSASASAAPATAAACDKLSGRIHGPGGNDLSASAATTTAATSGAPLRRTRLIFKGRRASAGHVRFRSIATVAIVPVGEERVHLFQRDRALGVDLRRGFRLSNGSDCAIAPLASDQNSGEAVDLAARAVVTKDEPIRI